jgi:hypothetical protein
MPGIKATRSNVSAVGRLIAESRKPSRSRSMPMWTVTSAKLGSIHSEVWRKKSYARWRS